jgi:hypothetical protein
MVKIKRLSLFIIALSLALNLHALAGDSFWGDEILTASFAGKSPAEVIEWTAEDIHPPLYYLIAGAFTRITVPLGLTEFPSPASDWLWRFPSVLAVVLTVAITYRLAYYVSSVKGQVSSIRYQISGVTDHEPRTTHYVSPSLVADFAVLLLAFAPVAIKYGQEARMHALFMMLSALSTWLLFRAMRRPERWRRWLAFGLATAANLYTMYFGFLILATQTLLQLSMINDQLSINKFGKSHFAFGGFGNLPWAFRDLLKLRFTFYVLHPLTGFTASVALALILYLPWWPVLFEILRRRAAVGAIEGGVGAPLEFVTGVVEALGPRPGIAAWIFLALFIVGLVFLTRQYWPMAVFSGLWLGLPALLPIVLGDPRALQFRYAFVLPVYLSVIAYAVVTMGRSRYFNGLRNFRRGFAQGRSATNVSPVTDPRRAILPKISDKSQIQERGISNYLLWLLVTLSFIGVLEVYHLVKPDWRAAAAYLDERTQPADIILIGPLWDEGRFIDYYYRGQAQLLTPAAMVTNIERRAEGLREHGGRVWAVNRFTPRESPAFRNIIFSDVVLSEPQVVVYEPNLLTEAAIDLAGQAVEAAYPWAVEARAGGILSPDPRTAKAAALRALGDALVAAGRPQEAIEPYQTAVEIFPGWVSGFVALAEAQQAVGNLPGAVEAYRQAVAYNLKWQGPAADEAAALERAGQWETALEKYQLIVSE